MNNVLADAVLDQLFRKARTHSGWVAKAVKRNVDALPGDIRRGKYHEAILEFKKDLIIRAIWEANGNYTRAADWGYTPITCTG